jgi:hypothetical protein
VAKIDKAFIDTSELFPFTVMDLLLTLADQFVWTRIWTDELLDGWERVIVETKHRAPNRRSRLPTPYAYFGSR